MRSGWQCRGVAGRGPVSRHRPTPRRMLRGLSHWYGDLHRLRGDAGLVWTGGGVFVLQKVETNLWCEALRHEGTEARREKPLLPPPSCLCACVPSCLSSSIVRLG